MLLDNKGKGDENMNIYLIGFVIGIIIGILSANPKFLEPYIFGFSVALVFTTLVRWLI